MKEQGLFHDSAAPEPIFSDTLELDLGAVTSSPASPVLDVHRTVCLSVAPKPLSRLACRRSCRLTLHAVKKAPTLALRAKSGWRYGVNRRLGMMAWVRSIPW
jgi:hypothetical protein